eukprot:TRINITY_DN6062_c1_g3_i1.p1 TRINITY_DN6062_c1_g3~~TRINITY_DN6062_c1_g3_i1.p1  ORF type:complete len:464 (+),score=114.10 TRINITY_DN6062_c1_g3_i1:119-1510(+)
MDRLYRDVWGVILKYYFTDIPFRSFYGAARLRCWKRMRRVNRTLKEHADLFFEIPQIVFYRAVINGNIDSMRFLLTRKEIDPSLGYPEYLPNSESQFALVYSCKGNSLEIIELLLSHPKVDVSSQQDEIFKRALHNSDERVLLKLLKDERMDWKTVSNHASFAFQSANCSLDVFRELWEYLPKNVKEVCLFSIIRSPNRDEMFKEFYDSSFDAALLFETAVKHANYRIIKFFLHEIEDDRIDPTPAFTWASQHFDLDVTLYSWELAMQLLIDDPRVNRESIIPFFNKACTKGAVNTVDALLRDPGCNLEGFSIIDILSYVMDERGESVVLRLMDDPRIEMDSSEVLKRLVRFDFWRAILRAFEENRINRSDYDVEMLYLSISCSHSLESKMLMRRMMEENLVDMIPDNWRQNFITALSWLTRDSEEWRLITSLLGDIESQTSDHPGGYYDYDGDYEERSDLLD